MSITKKRSVFVSLILIGVGVLLLFIALCSVKFDFTKLSTQNLTTKRYAVGEPFQNIRILEDSCDIRFVPSEDAQCTVLCPEGNGISHSIFIDNGTLTIEKTDKHTHKAYFGFFFEQEEITLYLPQAEYESLALEVSTGNVEIPKDFAFTSASIKNSSGDTCFDAAVKKDLSVHSGVGNLSISPSSAQNIDLQTTSGDIELSNTINSNHISVITTIGNLSVSDVTAQNMDISSTNGDVELSNVIASNRIQATSTIGNISLNHSDATSLDINTTSGNVSAVLLSDKIFHADSTSGDVNIPTTNIGGECSISTGIGDIDVEIDS